MPDDLRDRLAAALQAADEHSCQYSEGIDSRALADAVLAELQPELERLAQYESAINWQTSCLACSRVLDGSIAETERAEKAEAERDAALASLARVERAAALADVPDGGDERAAGFNAAMAVVRIALAGPAEQPKRHHAGDFLRAPKTGETPTISCEFDASIEIPELGDQNAAEQVPCSFAVLARMHEGALMPHAPHSWQPQPGMTPVWCPGPAGAGSTQDGAQ